MKSILTTLFKSFGDIDAYTLAVREWKWRTLLYFALITLISAVSGWSIAARVIDEFYDTAMAPSVEKLAGVKIEKGEFKTPNAADIELKDSAGRVFAIASQKYVDAAKTNGLLFAFEKDRITFYMPDGSENFISVSDAKDALEGAEVSKLIPSKNALLFAITPAIALALAAFMNAMYAATMTAATFLLSRTIFPELKFFDCAKIAIISLTPALFADILALAVFGVPIDGFFYALISGGVVFYVLKSFAKRARESSDKEY